MSLNTPAHEIRLEFEHVELLLKRLRLPFLLRHLPPKLVWSGYVFGSGFVAIALLALLGEVAGIPFVVSIAGTVGVSAPVDAAMIRRSHFSDMRFFAVGPIAAR